MRRSYASLALASALLWMAPSAVASAQEIDAAPPPPPAQPPLAEREAIGTESGRLDDVVEEPVPEPPAPVELRAVNVRFRANLEGVEVRYLPDPVLDDDGRGGVTLRVAEASRYTPLCTAPCDSDLPQTHLGLAFARRGTLSRSADPFGVDGPTGVRIEWHDRDGERLAGLLTLVLGIPAGLALGGVSAGVDLASGGDGALAGVGLGVGSAVLAAAISVGVYLAFRVDDASFVVTPLPAVATDLYSADWQ